ncbi:hypothetical protein GOBAR_DD24616 [Gossypium barbadense]|nr:hypothetical protein GOBAR_DD24616 [Gossypium barbadense]
MYRYKEALPTGYVQGSVYQKYPAVGVEPRLACTGSVPECIPWRAEPRVTVRVCTRIVPAGEYLEFLRLTVQGVVPECTPREMVYSKL